MRKTRHSPTLFRLHLRGRGYQRRIPRIHMDHRPNRRHGKLFPRHRTMRYLRRTQAQRPHGDERCLSTSHQRTLPCRAWQGRIPQRQADTCIQPSFPEQHHVYRTRRLSQGIRKGMLRHHLRYLHAMQRHTPFRSSSPRALLSRYGALRTLFRIPSISMGLCRCIPYPDRSRRLSQRPSRQRPHLHHTFRCTRSQHEGEPRPPHQHRK